MDNNRSAIKEEGDLKNMEQQNRTYQERVFSFVIIASSSALLFTSLHSFLLFHTLVELFTVVISFGIFAIAWSSRRYNNNTFLLMIGISYLFIGGLDLVHTLTYKGLNIISGSGANLPTQLWIAARYMEAISFIVAFLLLREKDIGDDVSTRKRSYRILIFYAVIFLAIFASIFYLDIFPVAYQEGTGLTRFKVLSEYAISLLFLGSLVFLFKKKRMFERDTANLLSLALIMKIGSELVFTEYIGVYDFSNVVGHIFRFISSLFLYKAVLESGLMRPYQFLFMDLKKSEERYRSLVEFSPDPIVVHSQGKIIYANGPAKKLFSAEKGMDLKGAELASFFRPDFREMIWTRIKKVTSGELRETPVTQMEVQRPDGKIVPVEIKGMRITFMGKEAVESIIRDISERKAAEEKIRSLAKFPEENPSPVIRSLVDGQVQYANRPAREMLSSLGWIDGKALPENLLLKVRKVLEENIKQEMELDCPERKSYSIMLAPSATEGWVNIYGRDITERKLTEEKLTKTQAELRKRIEDQLAESYKHLGLVNRKISLLLELERHSQSKKEKQEVVDYIVRSAIGLSHAKTGLLYIAAGKNHYNLISSAGLDREKFGHIQIVSKGSAEFIKRLIDEKNRVNGPCGSMDVGCFKEGLDPSYFVALPVLSRDVSRGFLFLGFTDRKSMDPQELEFLDVFSRHVSSALENSGIFSADRIV